MVDIDNVYVHIGEFGRQQQKYAAIILMGQCTSAMHIVFMVFVGVVPSFSCTSRKQTQIRACQLLNRDKCQQMRFYDNWLSMPAEYELLCDDAYKSSMAQSVFMFGFLVGSFLFGIIADKIGRQRTVMLVVCGALLCSLLTGISTSYSQFLTLRFLIGLCLAGYAIASFVLLCELIGASWRNTIGILMASFFAMGIGILGLMAYSTENWRSLSHLVTLFSLCFYSLYFFVPESPRWLVLQNRFTQVEHVLSTIAHGNGTHLPAELITNSATKLASANVKSGSNGSTISAIFLHWDYFKWTAIQILSWFANSCLYYGLTMASGNLSSNLYISVAMSGLVELPAYVILFAMLKRFGWISIVSGGMITGGMSCVMILMVDSAFERTVLGLLGKMAISASFACIYLQSAELFPTSARNSGIGLCSVAARLGGVMAPLISLIGVKRPLAEYLVFGIIGLSAGLIHTRLPETKGRPLPETLDDILALSATKSISKARNRRYRESNGESAQKLVEMDL